MIEMIKADALMAVCSGIALTGGAVLCLGWTLNLWRVELGALKLWLKSKRGASIYGFAPLTWSSAMGRTRFELSGRRFGKAWRPYAAD